MNDHGVVSPGQTFDAASLHAADEQAAADAVASGLVPLHAAAIEMFGRVVAFAGQSGAGKSTLAAAAVLAGDRYVADEITAVSPLDLHVVPYHRPIGLRQGGADVVGINFPDDRRSIPNAVHPWPVLGAERLSPGGRLDTIVIVGWDVDSTAEIMPIEPAQALTELSQHIVANDGAVPLAFGRLDVIVRTVRLVRLVYDTPSTGVHILHEAASSWR